MIACHSLISRTAPFSVVVATLSLSTVPDGNIIWAVAALIVLIVASDPVVFLRGLRDTVPLAAIWVALSFPAGWWMGSAIGASPPDRFTLATEFATRNIAVATAIALTLAGRLEFAVFGTVYFLTEIPLMPGATVLYRRLRPSAEVGVGYQSLRASAVETTKDLLH